LADSVHLNSWNGRESIVLHLCDWHDPDEEWAVNVYDRRLELERGLRLDALLDAAGTVLTVFWPGFARTYLQQLPIASPLRFAMDSNGPLFFKQQAGSWQPLSPSELQEGDQLFWLDPPWGRPSLERLAELLGSKLYRLGIHLLYNGNDIDRAYKLLETHGPNRQALAVLFRILRATERVQWSWEELAAAVEAAGLRFLPEQVQLHLTVMQELSLAEVACSAQGARIRLLPPPASKQELRESPAFVSAEEQLAAFALARDWLRGPDAASKIARELMTALEQSGRTGINDKLL
jgi:hypothetical protein